MTSQRQPRVSLRSERGGVLVIVAGVLLTFLFLVVFVAEAGHWFSHRRALQVQADAAATAAGAFFGGCAFAPGASDTLIQTTATQYVTYNRAEGPMSASSTDKGTLPPARYNKKTYAIGGPPADDTIEAVPCTAKMLDVKLTEDGLNVFPFGLLGFTTVRIHARARVEIQPLNSSDSVRPIAVRDAKVVPCVSVNFINESTGAQIGSSVALTKQPPVAGQPDTWTANTSVAMPSGGAHVAMQAYLNNCAGNGDLYDPWDNKSPPSHNSGIVFVNSFNTTAPTATGPPVVVGTGSPQTGVTLSSGCATAYFSEPLNLSDCSVDVVANVQFNGTVANNKRFLTVTDLDTGVTKTMNAPGSSNVWTTQQPFAIGAESGPHNFKIDWRQEGGSIGSTLCGNGNASNPPPCKGTLGIQQRTFSGYDDTSDPPQDSGSIVYADVSGPHSYKQGTSPSVTVTIKIKGLDNAQPGDPPVVLRVGTSTNKATGLIDCGQGNGASADADAIINGCPNPLEVNTRNGVCDPEPPSANEPFDCVGTISGTRRNQIPGAIATRINCSDNNWPAYINGFPSGEPANWATDPRKILMVITAPADLSGVNSPTLIPIRKFATFYVTGWDPSAATCNKNEPYPGKGKKNQANGAIWGYWMSDTLSSGQGTGGDVPCDFTQFGDCIAVLTR